jgi:hypothetical protein
LPERLTGAPAGGFHTGEPDGSCRRSIHLACARSRRHVIKKLVAALAVLTGLVTVGTVDPATAQSGPPIHRFSVPTDADVVSVTSPEFDGQVATANITSAPDCGAASSTAVPDGQPIVVSLPPAAPFTVGHINPYVWRHPMVADPSWRLHFEGFMYLPPLAVRASRDGQLKSLATIVGQVVAFHSANPDPGTSRYGWDEGTAQRRLQVENCLYELSHDTRLVTSMASDVRVQLGPRYYGPPNFPVHNHGLMANLRMVRAGELLNHPIWVSTALDRMRREAPLAFSPAGTTWEQSSSYQQVDTSLWQQAANQLAQRTQYATVAAAIRATTAKAARVVGWMTEPDGKTVQIGDSDNAAGAPTLTRSGVFRDTAAGYVIGRWLRTDPRTMYYTLRFGPSRRAHGQYDRGSLTWSVLGTRVLVGPGRFNYGTTAMGTWRLAPIAHNMAIPLTGYYSDRASASLTGYTIQAQAHAYRIVDSLYGRTHTRDVDFLHATHRLVVRDAFAGGASFRQYWHLDPAWRLVSAPVNGTVMVFRTATGRVLRITTTGRLSGVVRGSTSPVAGWNFPSQGVRYPAYQISIRSQGTSVTTTFTLS